MAHLTCGECGSRAGTVWWDPATEKYVHVGPCPRDAD